MKFEYKIISINESQQAPDQIEKVLNAVGETGWEVVATLDRGNSTPYFVLKKPKE